MDLEQGLTIELSALPGLEKKVFPIVAAQGTEAPYITYVLGSSERTSDLLGNVDLIKSQYQLDLYHPTYAGLKAFKKTVLQRFITFNMRNLAGIGPFVQQAEIVNDYETYEFEVKLYRGIIEFEIHSTE